MKKLLLLIFFIISFTYIVSAQSATYVVAVGHMDPVADTLVEILPSGITTADIEWSIELQANGTTCSKDKTDQPPVWMVNTTNKGPVQVFQLNLSIFSGCSMGGRPAGWVTGDDIVLKMKINKPGHDFNGATATCILKAAGGVVAGMQPQGIIFEQPKVIPTISVTGATLCLGETGKTVTATVKDAPTGFSIDWGNANITTGTSATQGVIGTGLAAGTHNLTAKLKNASGAVIKDESGNDISAKYTVTVNANPTINLDKTEICKNASVSFSVTGGKATYKWTGDVTGNATSRSKTYATAGTQNYTVNVEDANKCTATKTGTITVNDLPSVSIGALAKTDVCVGDKVEGISATATGGSGNYPTYTWTGATGSGASALIESAKAGDNKVSLTVTDNKNCTSARSNEVTVVGHEVKTIAITDVDACVGSAGTLSATVTFNPANKQGSPTYEWTPVSDVATGGNTTSMTSITYSAVGDHEFTLKVTDGFGCSQTQTAKVKVKTCVTPEIKINDLEFCAGDQPGTIVANVTGITGYSIDWGISNITSAANSSTGNISGTLASGTYTAKLKDASGNVVDTKTYSVTVKPKPTLSTISASSNPVALNGTSTLQVTSNGTVTWSGSPIQGTNAGLSITAGPFTAANTYTYTATAVSAEGCNETKNITITVEGAPLTVTPPSSTPTGLKGDPIPVCVTAGGGDCDGNYIYTWSSPDAGVTVTPTTDGCANVTSPTSGNKTVCASVRCGDETKETCFTVKVTEGDVDLQLEWTITEIVCQYPGETRTISIEAVGAPAGTKFSFVLSAPDGSAALTVNGDEKTTWTYVVTGEKKGTYKIANFSALLPDGTTTTGPVSPGEQIDADFYKVPAVYANGVVANSTLEHCEGEELILTGSGDAVKYDWDNGVQNGQPFIPTVAGTYKVTGVNEYDCAGTDQVTVNLNPKPELSISVSGGEICPGEEVTLSATTDLGTVAWNNGVTDGIPMKIDVSGVHKFTATATAPETGCTVSKDTVVLVKEKPTIVYHSKNPRNIAIGKDVYFAVKAVGTGPLSYEWYRKVGDDWSLLDDNSVSLPTVGGATTDSLVLKTVPESWDGSELKVVVKNECDTASMIFQLGVKECFEVEIAMLMQEGIIPDTDPTNKIDGWYCRGRRIALRAILSSPEGYDIENAHYRWTIDGLELPEEHFELETDTCVLTWIPEFQEDDIVVKVCGYSDGACEEVCVQYVRLKAREFEKVSLELLTSVDPEHIFCPGDTVDFWVTAKNVGDSAHYEWYNDIFHLPEENPRNVLLSYAETKLTLVMGQEDTWMKVFVTPSQEVCTEEPVYMDTVFLRKGPWVTPSLRIINNIEDTMACRGDRILFTAVYENAGANPTFSWRKDVWDWGHEQFAEATLDDKDMWLKCWMVPGKDVCYDGSLLVDSMVIRILENPTVVISADLINKAPGDEIIIESEVTNMPTNAHYTWYLNYDYTLSNSDYPEYISDKLTQGDVIQCGVTGERICTSEVMSNELVIYFGDRSRDTMITIYQGEKIHNLNMRRRGDTENRIFRITADGYPRWGIGSMNFNGYFDYIPNAGFVGSDVVKYEVVDKFDQTKVETGYIYISVLDRKRFFIPNIITPNGDGVNDTWNLEFLADYPDHHITIYNRDGVVVFEATNYQNDWDGTGTTTSGYVAHFNLANGVYTYVIDLGNKEILKNWIEIRRDMNRGKYKY